MVQNYYIKIYKTIAIFFIVIAHYLASKPVQRLRPLCAQPLAPTACKHISSWQAIASIPTSKNWWRLHSGSQAFLSGRHAEIWHRKWAKAPWDCSYLLGPQSASLAAYRHKLLLKVIDIHVKKKYGKVTVIASLDKYGLITHTMKDLVRLKQLLIVQILKILPSEILNFQEKTGLDHKIPNLRPKSLNSMEWTLTTHLQVSTINFACILLSHRIMPFR